jgi:hypothetical protein
MKRSVLCGVLLVAACATVREEDTASWVGRPVSDLEKQPVFLTMPVVRTHATKRLFQHPMPRNGYWRPRNR